MPSKSITISKPIISAPTVFTVSFRLVGDVTWTLHGDEDNDTFTLTVPTDGDYEILVELEGCPDTIYGPIRIEEAPPCDCPVTDTENITFVDIDASTTIIRIPFTAPLPADPPCGWVLVLRNKQKLTTRILTFPTLTNPLERVVDRGDDYDYELRADCCAQVYNYCLQGTLLAPEVQKPCQPIILENEGTALHVPDFLPGLINFNIRLKQSIPASTPVTYTYNQIRKPFSTGPSDVGVGSVTAYLTGDPTWPWQINIPVSPYPGHMLQYYITIRDTICGGEDIVWL